MLRPFPPSHDLSFVRQLSEECTLGEDFIGDPTHKEIEFKQRHVPISLGAEQSLNKLSFVRRNDSAEGLTLGTIGHRGGVLGPFQYPIVDFERSIAKSCRTDTGAGGTAKGLRHAMMFPCMHT